MQFLPMWRYHSYSPVPPSKPSPIPPPTYPTVSSSYPQPTVTTQSSHSSQASENTQLPAHLSDNHLPPTTQNTHAFNTVAEATSSTPRSSKTNYNNSPPSSSADIFTAMAQELRTYVAERQARLERLSQEILDEEKSRQSQQAQQLQKCQKAQQAQKIEKFRPFDNFQEFGKPQQSQHSQKPPKPQHPKSTVESPKPRSIPLPLPTEPQRHRTHKTHTLPTLPTSRAGAQQYWENQEHVQQLSQIAQKIRKQIQVAAAARPEAKETILMRRKLASLEEQVRMLSGHLGQDDEMGMLDEMGLLDEYEVVGGEGEEWEVVGKEELFIDNESAEEDTDDEL